MNYNAQFISKKYSNPIEFLNQLRKTTEPIGGGMEYCNKGEYVEYDVAVEAVKKAQQQLIDKACEAFCKCECCGDCGEHKTNCIILGEFKQAMKGE